MMGKQALVDLLIVLVIPALFVGVYYFFFHGDNATLLLSSSATPSTVSTNEPGAKTELILKTLHSIHLDDSLFGDPAYLSLKTYTVTIPTVPISRPFPFTPPPVIIERLRQSHAGVVETSSSVSSSPKATIGISTKINMIKGAN